MAALKMTPLDLGQQLQINERFGLLLLEERQNAGRSVRTIARRFKISRRRLQRWEQGLSSPPSKVFCKLVRHYGPAAFERAQMLDLQVQLEKYELLRRQTTIETVLPSFQEEMPMQAAA